MPGRNLRRTVKQNDIARRCGACASEPDGNLPMLRLGVVVAYRIAVLRKNERLFGAIATSDSVYERNAGLVRIDRGQAPDRFSGGNFKRAPEIDRCRIAVGMALHVLA